MTENAIETVRLLVVSREASVLRPLWAIGESNAWHLETAGSGWEAMERVQSAVAPHLLLLDLTRGNGDSLHLLRWLRRLRPEIPVIVVSHAEGLAEKDEAVRVGAKDFLIRPIDEKQLESVIRRHLTFHVSSPAPFTSEDVEQLGDEAFFVGVSGVMQKLRAQSELLAQVNVPVLIVGEAGSGIDTTARLIHKLSLRSEFRLMKVNCGALPSELLEREIFGREDRPFDENYNPLTPGKLELCDRGTILLDEIAQLPLDLQEKLLHAMQSKQIHKGLGNLSDVDVRVLASTNMNIEKALSEKVLREDLYYRLSAFTIHVPALRERRDEIPFLLQHFMHKLAKHYSLPPREFSPAVLEASQRYSWPGNLRELENFAKRYLMLGYADLTLGSSDASIPRTKSRWTRGEAREDESTPAPKSLKSLIDNVKSEAERSAIAAALEKTGWNRKAAAQLLKVSYRTILYKIDQYKMRLPQRDPSFGRQLSAKNDGNGSYQCAQATWHSLTTGEADPPKQWTSLHSAETSPNKAASLTPDPGTEFPLSGRSVPNKWPGKQTRLLK